MPKPVIQFFWSGYNETREVWVYVLREGALADDTTTVKLLTSIQREAELSESLAAFKAALDILAASEEVVIHFSATPDHTDPFGERVSIGVRPAAKESLEPLDMWDNPR